MGYDATKGSLVGRSRQDSEFLAAALIGYQQRRAEIDGKIVELRQQLGGSSASVPAGSSDGTRPARKRTMSPAGRKRIAEAQRKRWKAFHQAQEPAAAKKAAPAARGMSAAGRKRIARQPKSAGRLFGGRKKRSLASFARPGETHRVGFRVRFPREAQRPGGHVLEIR